MSEFLARIEKLSPKRLALLALDLQSRLDEIERQRAEPIAIVGIGCRMPGSEPGPEGFWNLLASGRDAISQVPEDRWDGAAYYHADPDTPGRTSTLWGGFLAGIDCFDAPFFNISRREAISMDPQQRLLLEVCWEALEHAGQSPGNLSGTSTGVFVGVSTIDYYNRLLTRGEEAIDAYLASGTAHSVAAGRISYVLGLRGPSIAVDTSCSASLAAVHLACQSLRTSECRLALAGGVNAILSPEVTIALSKAHMMAADGRCKTFDAGADGFVRGEGCGVVVLKRLSDALGDGDRILALIRGSAVNQDGRSSGLTAPNGTAQEAVIRQALANARVRPEEISYVEAHGTGTSLGDPIEAHALAAVFGSGRTAENPLIVGSVKTNIGHLEAAAGVAGLIKTVLALEHERIPKHLNFRTLNPHIDWEKMPVRIPVDGPSWPREERKRLAGVSSFGFSGTNVHLILEEAPRVGQADATFSRPLHILAISARNPAALQTLSERYGARLAEGDVELADFCFTANSGRATLEERAVYLAATREQMQDALRGEPLTRGKTIGVGETVFLFPGQGAQYAGMGSELYQTHPEFRRAIDECAELLRMELEAPLLEVLWGSRSALLDQTSYTQPALFAIEYALAQLWISWGIQPAIVLGHSVGEYVAACVAGVYDLADGLKLIARRAALMQAVRGRGAMAAVMASESQVREALHGLESQVLIAALNAPESQVISGYEEAVEIAEQRLKRSGVHLQRLPVSHAFHSPQMAEMEMAFEEVARGVRFSPPRVELVSSVTGKSVTAEEMADPAYWRRQVREPVRFQLAMETLASRGLSVFLEAGPGRALQGLARQTIDGPEILWTGSVRKGRGEWLETLESLGRLWTRGADVDWSAFDRPYPRRRVALPTYPFERHHYWVETGVRRSLPVALPIAPDDWFYQLDWELKPFRSTPQPTASAAELSATLSERASVLRTEYGLDRYDSLRVKLNAACTDYVVEALTALGWELSPGARVTETELVARCGILKRYHSLFRRMLAILVDEGILARTGDSYLVIRSPSPAHPAEAMTALLAEYPTFHFELEMTARCVPHLASVLAGRTDPLQLLFPAGSTETAEGIYTSSPGPRVFNRLAAEVVAAELKARPTGSIRVLEIGAGTGGTTAYLLPLLPADRTEYVFTDVSTFFEPRAREKFGNHPILRFQTLNIDKDPETQGFQKNQFDIVIAANVLHAALDLREAVRRISSLLAPGGIVVLVEGTYPEPWVDLTFGLTDGWWRFRDYELRPSYPLLARPAWIELLTERGLVDADAIQPLEGSHQSVFFARAQRANSTPGRCLILSDQSGVANSLAKQVEIAGGTAVVMGPEESIETYLHAESDSWDHIVELRPMGAPDLAEMSPAQVGEDAFSRAAGPITAVQAMVRNQIGGKLWVVTAGAQVISSSRKGVAITESTAWGVARCIRLEQPSLWGGVLDLDTEASSSQNASHCLASLLLEDGDDQAAFRNGRRYVPRLVRSERPPANRVEIRSDRVYLVTGGLGGLGLRVAHWLVQCGAREIILAGRTGLPDRLGWDSLPSGSPDARRIAAVKAMEDLGARVTIAAVDVADETALAVLFGSLPAGRLGGIIHAAAALAANSLVQMTPQDLAAMLRAKTQGTWGLHRLTASMNLDFFVLFSSNSSLLGGRDLAHYTAANQFLDAFAHYRCALGLPAIAINWGAWPHFGGTSDTDRDRLYRGGLVPMPWEGALAALGLLISLDVRQAFVGNFDWSVLRPLYESQKSIPLLEHISNLAAVPGAEHQPTAPRFKPLLSDLAAVAGPDREPALLHYLVDTLASILRTETAAIDPDRPVTDFGVDSLIALEFRNRLDSDLQVSITTVSILKGPSLRQLARLAAKALPGAAKLPVHELAVPTPEFPLAFGQQTQWFAHKFMPGSSTFNVAFTAKASPHLAWKEFGRALEKLVARHPALRTIFVEDEEGRPKQRALSEADPDLAMIDAAAWHEKDLTDAVLREFHTTFALDRPPFRVRVFRRPDSDVIFFNVDHIIIDAWSVRICFADLRQLYAAEITGANPALPPIAADYAEFVENEAKVVEGPEGERLWDYWNQQLAGDLQTLRLPSSRPRPAVLTVQGERIPLEFGPQRSSDVQRLARDHRVTPYAVLLAAYNVLLYHFTGQNDVVVGTSAFGREDPRWANAVGYFVNLLPLRAKLIGNPAFVDHLLATRDTVFAAIEHQNLPFAQMVTRLRVRRNLDRSPVFQAFFNFITDRSGDLGPLFVGGRDCAVQFGNSILTPSIIIPQQEGQSEIALQLTEVEGELIGNLTYNTEILDRPVAGEMADAYRRILDAVIRNPNLRIDDLKDTSAASSSQMEDLVF